MRVSIFELIKLKLESVGCFVLLKFNTIDRGKFPGGGGGGHYVNNNFFGGPNIKNTLNSL